MYDNPRRWIQALENRVQYVEKRLRSGSPVIGLPYENGALLFAMRPRGQQKLFEVYDRLAMGGLGHPADVERLRMMAVDLAHLEGFERSADDVTLQRLLHFQIAPQIKQAFDETYRSPYIVKCLLTELNPATEQTLFFTLNFDGNFSARERYGAAAGIPAAEEQALQTIEERLPAKPILEESLRCAAAAWSAAYCVALREADDDEDAGDSNGPADPTSEQIGKAVRAAMERYAPEAAVLDRAMPGKAKYRRLEEDDLRPAQEELQRLQNSGENPTTETGAER